MKSILLLLSLALFSQAAHNRIPLRVHQLKKNFNTQLDDDDAPKPIPFQDSALVIEVTVDGKKYSVALDSLSNLFWLAGDSCDSPFCKKAKQKIPVSSTKTPADHGVVSGYLIQGKLQIGEDDALVDIVAADYVAAELAKRLPPGVDGVLGLMNKKLFSDLLLMEPIVSLYVNKWNRDESGFYSGSIPMQVAKRDIAKFPPRYLRSEGQNYLKLSLDYIGNSDGPWEGWSVGGSDLILDTSYSGIAGPSAVVDKINKYIGTDDDGYIDCNKVPYLRPLTFHINGASYDLDSKNYIRNGQKHFDVRCKSVFEAHRSIKNFWKLGIAFIKQYMLVLTYSTDPVLVSFVETR